MAARDLRVMDLRYWPHEARDFYEERAAIFEIDGGLTRLANRATVLLDDQHVAVSEEVRLSMSPRVQKATEVIGEVCPVSRIVVPSARVIVTISKSLR